LNYNKHYNLLISKSQNRSKPDVYEKHHILPKSMTGTNDKSNIAYLTPREHYIAHHLLWKIHRTRKMFYAFWLMVTKFNNSENRKYRVSSRVYESAKRQHRIESSMTHTGKPCWAKGLTGIHSKAGLENISKAQRGRVDSVETRSKKSKSHTGVKKGPSPLRGRPMPIDEKWSVECPHCNKIGVDWNMKRYHFDNCKAAK